MNKKIFTLLASALMLFSAAFNANARFVAERSIGDDVKTLAQKSTGMYHIRIDSIFVPDGTIGLTGDEWLPVSYDGLPLGKTGYFGITGYNPDNTIIDYGQSTTYLDTMILSITEGGEVMMISAGHLRNAFVKGDVTGGARLEDLLASFWCVAVEEDVIPNQGQLPTYHFTNRVFDHELDYYNVGTSTVGASNQGWMFSGSYMNNQLRSKLPFYRFDDDKAGYYRVIVAEYKNGAYTGKLETVQATIEDFVAERVPHMLKFTIVKASPFVLTANDVNTSLGNTKEKNVKLNFIPEEISDNPFGNYLFAETSHNPSAELLGYLNVKAYSDEAGTDYLGYIANSNKSKNNADVQKYDDQSGVEFLKLHTVKATAAKLAVDTDDYDSTTSPVNAGDYNYSYRFVYFPSEDSLVINAYHVHHETHAVYGTGGYTDLHNVSSDPAYYDYLSDGSGNYYYYGLYSKNIHDRLIVRYQDLSHTTTKNMMTIGEHPSNVRIYFGINSCEQIYFDAWQVPEGVYTIWDNQGRCLGVRIYNGSYTPQWMKLAEGECPDRIPAYQWVIQKSNDGHSINRVDILNREFGDLAKESTTLVGMRNVLVQRGSNQIFKGQGQFVYSPIVQGYDPVMKYEPIIYGWVEGQLLDVLDQLDCSITENSGFRPVTNAYLEDEFLGYKHFHVDQDPASVSYGKSEDTGDAKGMDYNAFAFNYLHSYGEQGYIDLKANHGDSILWINKEDETQKEGFQFMLGTYLRSHQYAEEIFGYPRTVFGPNKITDDGYSYDQVAAPVLKRYYYELKVADFYDYRDGLAEQYVVLKGAKVDNSDVQNALKYGVADVWADKDPFKFANVYLRETYFLKRDKKEGEERKYQDDTRRVFYALLDRIEAEQLERVTSFGLQVSDTLMGEDGTSKYNLVTLAVDDYALWVKAQGKTVSTARASTFALENMNYPLYRRLRSLTDDNATPEGDGVDPEAPCQLDAPKVLRIYRQENTADYLHEDALSQNSYNTLGINYLGVSNNTENKEELAPDGTVKYNYHLFIDTAFINRGTGWIKPQYLIAVGQKVVKAQTVYGLDNCNNPVERDLMPYVEGRYLINATDSARVIGSNGTGNTRDENYKFGTDDRLVFVPAIHVDDRLYIVSRMQELGVNRADYIITTEDGEEFIDGAALRTLTETGLLKGSERTPQNSAMYGAFYDFGVWDNYHNDVCFSLRFRQPHVENPDAEGNDTFTNFEKRFYIESETTNRTPYGNRKIAPVQGGWVRVHNDVPVLSRGSYEDAIKQAEIFNVEVPTSWQNGEATSNDPVAGKVTVVGGNGEVTILNATGKQVTLSNILGQTIVTKKLTNDKETVSTSKGIVIVTVEGESAVKTIVK